MSEISYIPPEVVTQILQNLPVKTLLRFRRVCKSWCSIIDHPNFVSMHLKYSSVRRDKDKLLFVLERLGFLGESGCSLTVLQTDTLKNPNHIFRISDEFEYDILGACDGLLLVQRYSSYKEELRLWNPCIRKSLILPTNPLPPSLIGKDMYIFGFSPESNDYKVVAVSFKSRDRTMKMYVAVYTLSDQQWTVRNDGLNINHSYLQSLFKGNNGFSSKSNTIYFQGAAHWLGNNPHGDIWQQSNQLTHFVSFDFDTERFTFSELPFALYEEDSLRVLFLRGESLAIFSISSVSSSIRVLENGVWTLQFSGSSSNNGYNLFSPFTFKYSKEKVLYCESDGGRLICGEGSYNIATCQVPQPVELRSSYLELEAYSESLLLYKGYGAKDLMSFP
ncbi:F-box/kelch-repeat protein At3g06240-like [Silene latifolia]|uniref:F-box/kelch-repeat protein At3g06240-like n=1 Tax=Silene latifolia TaxID=37657 RepID=UPI003D7786A5